MTLYSRDFPNLFLTLFTIMRRHGIPTTPELVTRLKRVVQVLPSISFCLGQGFTKVPISDVLSSFYPFGDYVGSSSVFET